MPQKTITPTWSEWRRPKAARLGVAGLALLGLAACSGNGSQSTASAPPPPPAAAPTAPVAQVTIKDVQSALQNAGYYKGGKVDGVWGRMTQRAVTRFQHDHNMTASGKLDVPTLQALNMTGAPPSTSPSATPPATSDTSTPAPTAGTTAAPPPSTNTAPPATTGTPPATTATPPAGTTTTPNR